MNEELVVYEKKFHLSNGNSVRIESGTALVRSSLSPVPLEVFSHLCPVLPYDEGVFVRVSVVVDLVADRHSVEFTDMGRTDVYFPGADVALRILGEVAYFESMRERQASLRY